MTRLWREHFPLRLAATTAAMLAITVVAMLVTLYVATALMWLREVDARGAALIQRRPDPAQPWEAQRRRPPEDEDEDDDEGEPEQAWRWSIHVRSPYGPRRSAWAWLWPHDDDVRVARLPDGRWVVAQPMQEMARMLAQLRGWLAGVGLVGVVATSAVAFSSARRAFQPVEQLIEAATPLVEAPQIGPHTLTVQLPSAAGDRTLRRLAELFNTLLSRVREAMVAQVRFVDDASHELRTPISALRAELEVALRTLPASPQAADPAAWRATLERLLGQVERLGRLADDLLVLARYERGALVQPVAGTDAAGPLQQALADVAHLAEQRGVSVVADIPQPLVGRCDGQALSRLAVNLLRNAIEATPPGGVVELLASRSGPAGVAGAGLVVEVVDTGRGMSQEEAARAFEPFFRGSTPPGQGRPPGEGGGAGLGLAIVRAIVEAHGGRVELQTAPGRGTRVRVWLPDEPPVRPGLSGGGGSGREAEAA